MFSSKYLLVALAFFSSVSLLPQLQFINVTLNIPFQALAAPIPWTEQDFGVYSHSSARKFKFTNGRIPIRPNRISASPVRVQHTQSGSNIASITTTSASTTTSAVVYDSGLVDALKHGFKEYGLVTNFLFPKPTATTSPLEDDSTNSSGDDDDTVDADSTINEGSGSVESPEASSDSNLAIRIPVKSSRMFWAKPDWVTQSTSRTQKARESRVL
jgi:hypothetical protein